MIRAQSLKLKYTNGPVAPYLLLKDTRLTPLQKLVWLVIRDHEGKNSKAWPSLETISEKVGATRKGVIDAINGRQAGKNRKESDGLTSLGWLTVVKKYAGKARNVANHYECWLPAYSIEEEETHQTEVNIVPTEVNIDDEAVNIVHSAGVQDVPVTNPLNQSKNQSIEPIAEASPSAVVTSDVDDEVTTTDGRTSMKVGEAAGVNAVIEAFRPVCEFPPFKNKTQRTAAKQLIDRFGLEATLSAVKAVIAKQGEPYFPVIVSPYDLVTKWGKVKASVEKNKPKQWKEIRRDGTVIIHNA